VPTGAAANVTGVGTGAKAFRRTCMVSALPWGMRQQDQQLNNNNDAQGLDSRKILWVIREKSVEGGQRRNGEEREDGDIHCGGGDSC
jgi:hypothetical protein